MPYSNRYYKKSAERVPIKQCHPKNKTKSDLHKVHWKKYINKNCGWKVIK